MRSHIKITKMKAMTTDQYDRAVVHVEWAKAAIDDDGTRGAALWTSDFDPEKITGHFVPFEELTEAVVLSWVMKDYERNKEKIDKALMADLDRQRKAKTVQHVNLPWVSQ